MRAKIGLLAAVCLAASAAAPDYPAVVAGHILRFPHDHGAHPEFRTEWWYVTGRLTTAAGKTMGFQVTFFRSRPAIDQDNPSRFAPRQLLFAHAAIADPEHGRLLHDQRVARAGFGLADARSGDADVWIDDWRYSRDHAGYRTIIAAREFELHLDLKPTQAVMLQGESGFSRKGPSPEQASYYYSEPQLAVSGRLQYAGREEPVQGRAWMDHEWSTAYLDPAAAGWDWTGINLDDGGALMLFRIRAADGRTLWAGGTLREPSGAARTFAANDVLFEPLRHWRSARTGATYPVAMRVSAAGVAWELEPVMDDQELDSRASTGAVYWEGAVAARRGGRIAGLGYLELTGYFKPLRLQ